MRCNCCNNLLTPQESVRRFKDTDEFTDTCSQCLKHIPRDTKEGRNFKDLDASYEDDSQEWLDNLDEEDAE